MFFSPKFRRMTAVASTGVELSGLMPSVPNRAFKGEL